MVNYLLCRYWELKKEMAAGSEPPHIARMFTKLRSLCTGQSLCGAGAGGFAVVVLRRDCTVAELRACIDRINDEMPSDSGSGKELMSVHGVVLDCAGIRSEIIPHP